MKDEFIYEILNWRYNLEVYKCLNFEKEKMNCFKKREFYIILIE